MSYNEPVHCYGIVTMIDALGTRGFSIEQCKDFFKVRQDLIENSLYRWQVASHHSSKSYNTSKVKIYIQSFADTLILAVEMKEFGSVHGNLKFPTGFNETDNLFYGMWLERLAYVLGDLIRDALYQKIVFRGAMSVGEYIIHEDSNSILGPAIIDAARYYEKFESIGIILTPNSSAVIDNLSKQRSPWLSLIKSEIPFKDKKQREVYVINWPNAFCKEDYSEIKVKKVKKDFQKIMSELHIPSGTEQKYNTANELFERVYRENTKQ